MIENIKPIITIYLDDAGFPVTCVWGGPKGCQETNGVVVVLGLETTPIHENIIKCEGDTLRSLTRFGLITCWRHVEVRG